jgi:tetratricopeptide (TPR) repeat protein
MQQAKQSKLVENIQTDLIGRFRPAVMALALVIVCFAAHGISIWNGYVLNDHFLVPGLRDILDWPQHWSDLVTEAMIKPFADPMLKATLGLDYLSSRLAPALYHATNVFLHTGAVLSAFFLLRRLVPHFNKAQTTEASAGNNLVPFIACLLFAAHPLTSDVVAYVSGRSAALTLLWYTLALHAFLTGFISPNVMNGLFGYLFCYISVVLSLFSSCQAITIPETMIVLGLLVRPHVELAKDWIYERSWEFGIAFVTCLILPLLFLLPQTMPVGGGLGLPLLAPQAYYATELKVLVTYYLRAFFVPVPLSVAPPFSLAHSLADPLALAGAGVLVFSIYMLFRLRRDPFCFFGLWLFLIGLVPQAFIVTNEYVSGERFYLSCFGLCLVAARLFCHFVAKTVKPAEGSSLAVEPRVVAPLALVLLAFILLSNYRDHGFATDSAVLRGALRAQMFDKDLDKDGYIRALMSLMLVVSGGEGVDKGLIEAKRALDINRNLPLAYLAMAKNAILRNDYDGAQYYAEKTLKLAAEQKSAPLVTGLADGCLLIAKTQLEQFSEPQKLKDLARNAMAVDPANSRLYLALGLTLLSEHKAESGLAALHQLAHAKRLDYNDINLNAPIAEAHLATGNPNDFESAYRAAAQLHMINPSDRSRLLLAHAALETGRIVKGFKLVGEVQTNLKGDLDANGLILMSGLFKQRGELEKAKEYLALAKKRDPKIEEKIHLWLKVKPLTPIEQAREAALEKGTPIQEKHPDLGKNGR